MHFFIALSSTFQTFMEIGYSRITTSVMKWLMQACDGRHTCRPDVKSLQTHLELRFVFFAHTHSTRKQFAALIHSSRRQELQSVTPFTWCPFKKQDNVSFYSGDRWKLLSLTLNDDDALGPQLKRFLEKSLNFFLLCAEFCFHPHLNVGLL